MSSWWNKFDADEFFSYQTDKVVVIRDKWLGITRILLNLAILGYIIGVVMVVGRGYLQFEVPVGILYSSLQKPPFPPNNFVDTTKLSYCDNYVGPNPSFQQLPCANLDEFDVNYPPDETTGIFSSSRVTQTNQTFNCKEPEIVCKTPWKNVGNPTSYYVAGLETFTIMVKHSFEAQNFYEETGDPNFAKASIDMRGKMLDYKGNFVMNFDPGSYDIFSLGLLMSSVGSSLEDGSDASGVVSTNQTFRNAGVVIVITITYENSNIDAPTYTYQPSRLLYSDYKVVRAIDVDDENRILFGNHGIKIVFIQTGEIGRFNVQTCAIHLVTALGMLAVASLIVDILMVKLMPMKYWYSQYKYLESVEFSKMDKGARRNVDYAILSDDSYAASISRDQLILRKHAYSDEFLNETILCR